MNPKAAPGNIARYGLAAPAAAAGLNPNGGIIPGIEVKLRCMAPGNPQYAVDVLGSHPSA